MVVIVAVITVITGISFSYSDELNASKANSWGSRAMGSDP